MACETNFLHAGYYGCHAILGGFQVSVEKLYRDHESCPLSGNKKCLLLGGCACIITMLNAIHNKALSVVERSSASQRVRYQRFDCIDNYLYLSYARLSVILSATASRAD